MRMNKASKGCVIEFLFLLVFFSGTIPSSGVTNEYYTSTTAKGVIDEMIQASLGEG